MSDLSKTFLLNIISEKCYDKYFLEYDFFEGDCFKALVSKGLGFGIIAGSLLVKVPQILKILNSKSVEGINLLSVLLDLCAITIHMSYSFVKGFPFTAWGDVTFLALQTSTIAALILFYAGTALRSSLFFLVYTCICYVLMGGMTPVDYLWSAQALNIPILIAGKLSQAITNYKNGSTGQLSAATCFMLFAGSLARIFTSVQETGDFMMILTYAVSSSLNGLIVAQLLYYWNKPSKKKAPQKQTQNATKSKKAKKAD